MSYEATLSVPDLSAGELWEVLWRRTLVPHWLGEGSLMPSQEHRRVLISDSAGPWRRGTLIERRWSSRIVFHLEPAVGWPALDGVEVVTVAVVVAEGGADAVELRITEVGPYAEAHRSEIEMFWEAALERLQRLLRQVAERRDSPRQAVVVIHGIGSQEPGRTLRALVASGVIADADAQSWVKPDMVSDSFELRRVTFKASDGRVRPTTDVFELYWAHQIGDTTLAQVADWVRRLLLRARAVPRPLRPAWALVWTVIVAVTAAVLAQFLGLWDLPRWLTAGGVVAAVSVVLWKAFGRGVVVDVLGDAARYLSPRPANVAHRQAIRSAGVELLDRLHERGDYDRIVVLGHSLGSVIAYDVLTYLWIRRHAEHQRPGRTDFKPVVAVEVGIGQDLDAERAQALQHAAWKQTRRNTQPWLVTDLVTVGSPLTYAHFLMSDTTAEFREAQGSGVLPTCPPKTEEHGGQQRCTFSRSYLGGNPDKGPRTFLLLDHASPFAVTRWTNLYFEVGWGGLTGDLVGGPVAPQFGPWVRDVPLRSPVRRLSHTWYWRPAGSTEHLDCLHRALAVECGRDLLSLSTEIPAFVIAERAVGSRPQAAPKGF